MEKMCFMKNLFQSLCCFASILFLNITLFICFLTSLKYGSNSGWILLVIICMVFILFFLLGFYWIFQKVVIDNEGIKIVLLGKTLKYVEWNKIESIEKSNWMRNPVLKIKTLDDPYYIHLDYRKKIIAAVKMFYEF